MLNALFFASLTALFTAAVFGSAGPAFKQGAVPLPGRIRAEQARAHVRTRNPKETRAPVTRIVCAFSASIGENRLLPGLRRHA